MSESTQASNITPYLWDETNDENECAEETQKMYNDFNEKLMVYEINGPLKLLTNMGYIEMVGKDRFLAPFEEAI